MRKSSFAALALIGSVALVGVSVAPAMAATDDTNAVFTVTGGALTITGASDQAVEDYADLTPGAASTILVGAATVSDLRATAGEWTASVALSAFVGTDGGTATHNVDATYTASAFTITDGGTVTFSDSASTPVDVGLDAATAADFQTGTVTGNNTSTWTAELDFIAHQNLLAGTYTATLTQSVLASGV